MKFKHRSIQWEIFQKARGNEKNKPKQKICVGMSGKIAIGILFFIALISPVYAFSLSGPAKNISIVQGQLFINGTYIPKTKLIDPDIVLRATILEKNATSSISPVVDNTIMIIGTKIDHYGHISAKHFSGMDFSSYSSIKPFTLKKQNVQQPGFGVISKQRFLPQLINNQVIIESSQIDSYEENLGVIVPAKSSGLTVKNKVRINRSRLGVR